MPRPDLTSHLTPAPLSVAATAERLGVSASTLRTWERRYGLGPQHREAGKRRRYGPEEIEMLESVVRLVRSGVSPSDAAASVREAHQMVSAADEGTDIADLITEAQNGCIDAVKRKIDLLITREGLLRTWTNYVAPSLKQMRYPAEGDKPGVLPRSVLSQAILYSIFEVAEQCGAQLSDSPPACPVLIIADDARELHAHIIGVALQWEGVQARIVPVVVPASDPTVTAQDIVNLVHRYQHRCNAHTIVLLGTLVADSEVVNGIDGDDHNLVLVGRHRAVQAAPTATRVQSLAACVEEVIELARNCSYDG